MSKPPSSISFFFTFIKINLLAAAIFLFFCLVSLLIASTFAYSYLQKFSSSSQKSWPELWQIAQAVGNNYQKNEQSSLIVLVLGTDQTADRNFQATLTDTIMLVKLDLEEGKVITLPIPRDLWQEEYQTKINALYSYGDKFYPGNPKQFVTNALSDFLGVPIDKTVILSIDDLGRLIETIGEIKVEVPAGFIDTQFPKEGIDPAIIKDPKILFKTVEFKAGKQSFNSQRALEYIRSRKADDPEMGSDLSRANRQQQVLMAIFTKITSPNLLSSPQTTGKLLKFYDDQFEQYWPLTDLLSAAIKFSAHAKAINFTNLSLPIFPKDQAGVIYHPNPKLYNNLWVYVEKEPGVLSTVVPKLLSL